MPVENKTPPAPPDEDFVVGSSWDKNVRVVIPLFLAVAYIGQSIYVSL